MTIGSGKIGKVRPLPGSHDCVVLVAPALPIEAVAGGQGDLKCRGSIYCLQFPPPVYVWLARAAAKSVVAELLRVDWATVGRMIERVVAEHTRTRDGDGLDGLRRIGIDEVAYRKGHRYLMCVICHDTGRVVWAAPGRSQATAAGFFQQLGVERCKKITAVSVDLHGGWLGVIGHYCPNADVCADPFHVIKLAGDALDELRRAQWQNLRETDPDRAKWLKGTRFTLRRRSDRLRDGDQTILDQLAETNHDVYLGWLLVDQLRAVYLARDKPEALARSSTNGSSPRASANSNRPCRPP